MNEKEFKKYIIKQEPGTLHLRLREEYNTSTLQMAHTMARVERQGVTVLKANTPNNPDTCNPHHMKLTSKEMAILAEGFRQVEHYWEEQHLPYRHVLLQCGCIIDWDAKDETGRTIQQKPLPFDYDWAWCENHEEARPYRFNVEDFAETEVEA